MDDKNGWKRYTRLAFDSKHFKRRARRAETLTTRHAHKFVIKKMSNIRQVRQYLTTWLIVVAALIAAVAVQMTWFEDGYKTEAAVPGGTYAEAALGPINTLNPLYARTNAELAASRLIFASLFTYDRTGHLKEDLASSLKTDKTGKIYTVMIKPGLTWQDGSRLTAKDVVYTVNAMKNPEVRAVESLRTSWQGIAVKALDDHTVRFTLPAPAAIFPHALTFAVLPQHILGSVQPGSLRESTFSIAPIGSGPFKVRLLQAVDGRDPHKILHLSASDSYHGGRPKLARFELHAYETTDGIIRALKVGDVNAAADINGLKKSVPANFSVTDYPIGSGVYALFNTKPTMVLGDHRIRQALQIGTDTREARQALDMNVPPLDLPFLSGQVSGVTLPKKPAYNQKRAMTLLERAGWKLKKGQTIRTKKGQPLTLQVVVIKDEQYQKLLDDLSRQWQRLGIEVQSQVFDPKATNQSFAQSVLQPRAYDVLINELVIGADPDVFAYWHSSQVGSTGFNLSNYKNGIADDALLSARLRTEPLLRAQKYKAFARQWLHDAPAIGLYQSVMEYAHTKNVSSLPSDITLPSQADRYNMVSDWTAERGQVYKTP